MKREQITGLRPIDLKLSPVVEQYLRHIKQAEQEIKEQFRRERILMEQSDNQTNIKLSEFENKYRKV